MEDFFFSASISYRYFFFLCAFHCLLNCVEGRADSKVVPARFFFSVSCLLFSVSRFFLNQAKKSSLVWKKKGVPIYTTINFFSQLFILLLISKQFTLYKKRNPNTNNYNKNKEAYCYCSNRFPHKTYIQTNKQLS